MLDEARELVFFRTQRTDVWLELLYRARPILIAVGNKFKIPFTELKYYTLQSLVAGRPHRLPDMFGVVGHKDKMYIFDQPILKEESSAGITEVKGTIARQGKYTGRAVVVNTVADMFKVKPGDVLITFMTAPNFLPAMRIAGAFVTNEGGLTCHAAIVAREMGKPCVIGTKIATKVFKDGDMVEVDAVKGIVRKI